MARWAGVQKVSRPMVSCQEMSQTMPMAMLVSAAAMRKLGQESEVAVRGSACASWPDAAATELVETDSVSGWSGSGSAVLVACSMEPLLWQDEKRRRIEIRSRNGLPLRYCPSVKLLAAR